MIKKFRRMFMSIMCGALLLSGPVHAANMNYSFSLTNSGKQYQKITSNYNKKTIKSDPWTLKVSSITCAGNYGINFCPVKYKASSNSIVKYCTASSVWRKGTGNAATIAFASGDASLIEYKLAARMDDDYHSNFKAGGWYNADNTRK